MIVLNEGQNSVFISSFNGKPEASAPNFADASGLPLNEVAQYLILPRTVATDATRHRRLRLSVTRNKVHYREVDENTRFAGVVRL